MKCYENALYFFLMFFGFSLSHSLVMCGYMYMCVCVGLVPCFTFFFIRCWLLCVAAVAQGLYRYVLYAGVVAAAGDSDAAGGDCVMLVVSSAGGVVVV